MYFHHSEAELAQEHGQGRKTNHLHNSANVGHPGGILETHLILKTQRECVLNSDRAQ